MTARLPLRSAALACSVSLVALAVAGPAFAGGSTGSVVVPIRAGKPTGFTPPPARPLEVRLAAAVPVRPHATAHAQAHGSTSGREATLSLAIAPGSRVAVGLQALMAGNWMGLLPIWNGAATTYGVPWQVLAAINKIESNNGTNLGPSSAGALGWMQFMPNTWAYYGVDANGDGLADPNNPLDAITSAARYLAASGAASNLPRAIFAYNHAWWYVDEVLALARSYGYRGDFSPPQS